MTTTPAPERVIQRLLSKVMVARDSGCWISLYSIGSHGYSQIGWTEDGKTHMRLGHRLSYEHHHGSIPEGMTVEHRCRVRRCINPDHLTILTNLDNARGGGGVHDTLPVPAGRKCGKGLHELLLYPSGAFHCRECAAERARRKYPGRVAARKARTTD